MIIFTTAYPEYALEGYSLDIIDYLVKPIPFERFLKAVQKAHDYHSLKQKTPVTPDYFFIKSDHKYERINYSEVLYVEAMQNYCIIYAHGRKLIAYITLTGLEKQLPKERFLKVHKSFLVSVEKINALDGHEILIGDARIPISRTLKDEIVQKIMGNTLFKRT
jgi:DNA-binding LytR/AlgR family response regulator